MKKTNRARILVVEDDANMRELIVLGLETGSFEVVAVEDGAIAMETIQKEKSPELIYQLMISDLKMPNLSGEDLIAEMCAKNIRIPVMVMSGHGDKPALIRLMRMGCSDFIDKPFTVTQLLDSVRMTLEKVRTRKLEQEAREARLRKQLAEMKRLLKKYETQFASMRREFSRTNDEPAATAEQKPPSSQMAANPACPEYHIEQSGAHATVTPQGNLPDSCVESFCSTVLHLVERGAHQLRFNLECVSDIGSHVLAAFAALAEIIEQSGPEASLEIIHATPEMEVLFRLTSLTDSYRLLPADKACL